jgi:Fur family ferric uptake transcriptional regulator
MERQTRQRGAIRRAFQRAGRPLSPAEVLTDARKEVSGLGIATVYRNIRALVEEGWLLAVELPGEAARYELAGQEHHHHFRCQRCSRVFDVPCTERNLDQALPAGFQLEGHDVVLFGTCDLCLTS